MSLIRLMDITSLTGLAPVSGHFPVGWLFAVGRGVSSIKPAQPFPQLVKQLTRRPGGSIAEGLVDPG
jgi:hypothetical protein